TVPVTAPLVAVPAVVKLAIVPIPVPTGTIRPVRTVGVGAAGGVPVRTVRAVGVWTTRTVPVGPIGTRRPRPIRTVRSFGPLRTVRTIGAARLVRLIPVGTVG